MSEFSVEIEARAKRCRASRLSNRRRAGLSNVEDGFRVEADFSQAAFWLVASFIGAPLRIYGLNRTVSKVIGRIGYFAPTR